MPKNATESRHPCLFPTDHEQATLGRWLVADALGDGTKSQIPGDTGHAERNFFFSVCDEVISLKKTDRNGRWCGRFAGGTN